MTVTEKRGPGRPRMTLLEVLKDKIAVGDGCWEWLGCRDSYGYGVLKWGGGKPQKAHRTLYWLMVGPIPAGLTIDHLCRNKGCVRPSHMEPVTTGENVRRRNLAVTHCPQGHEYTPENTYVWRGARDCRACNRKGGQ